MHRCLRLLPLIVLAGALSAPAAAHATVTEYGLTAGSAPADITSGPDGNLWFTQQDGIGRIAPAGAPIKEYTVGQDPEQITTGPDGALWFTDSAGTGQIGRFDPATETVALFPAGDPAYGRPSGIATGPDGYLWFTKRGGTGAIARINPTDHTVTEYTSGLTPGSEPTDIVAGDDGNLWFTESADPGRIGRIDPNDDTITEFSSGLTPNSGPSHIAASDGDLYFTQAGSVGSIKTDGRVEEYTTGLSPNAGPRGITEGGDGALWLTEASNPGRLGRLWPATDQILEFSGGIALDFSADSSPAGIARGPDGNVWFTESANPARIARATVPPRAEMSKPRSLGGGKVRLKAEVAPNSQATDYVIEWGPTTEYGDETAVLSAGSMTGPVSVSTAVDLALDAHYHARISASNPSGTAVSKDEAFYLTADGDVVKDKPAIKPPAATSTVIVPLASPGADQAPAPGAPAPAPAAPVLGSAVTVHPVSGSVFVKAPGSDHYVPLGAGASIRVGSLVDARRGHVSLRSARDAHGHTQTGTFWGGIFQIRQRRLHSRGITDLVLRGGRFADCPRLGISASASSLARDPVGRHRTVRRLWGQDHNGRFRTHGRDSVATVRGTRWVTTDRCDGTLTTVKQGKVEVRDTRRHHSVLLSAGHTYLARHVRR